NDMFTSTEGFDGHARWRQDISRQVHALDSDEAKRIAAAEAYLARFGFLFPERAPADLERLPDVTEDGHRLARVRATPRGGSSIALFTDEARHLVSRASFDQSFTTHTVRYGDYKPVDGMLLPFSVQQGDGAGDDALDVRAYRFSAPANAFEAPPSTV